MGGSPDLVDGSGYGVPDGGLPAADGGLPAADGGFAAADGGEALERLTITDAPLAASVAMAP